MTSINSLTSLAMLKVHHDLNRSDYVDYLVPFVSYALERSGPATAFALQRAVELEFGLKLPQRVIEYVLRRLIKRHVVRKESSRFHVIGDLDIADFASRRADARRRLQVVTNALSTFAGSRSVQWTEQEATAALTAYLNRYTIDCLEMYAEGKALPQIGGATTSDNYLVNAFIQNAYETSTPLFADIIQFVESQMLLNGLLCHDLSATTQKFAQVTFYLDTPLVLPLLGLDGEEKQALAEELVELLHNLRGRVAVFEHTVEEIDSVLSRCERSFDSPRTRSSLVSELRRMGKTASDIALVRASIHEIYKKLRIEIVRAPRHLKQFQVDETLLEEAIRDEISYWNENALRYDVNSIRSIYTLRGGKAPSRLEEAGSVLVTSNLSLARVAYQFGREHESLREVSAVITDLTLTTVAWLKAPLGAPDLPRLEVLASCRAAMQPREGLLLRFVQEIGRLKLSGEISPQQHEYLRLSPRVRDELMRFTLGDERRLTRVTVTDIIRAVEDQVVSAAQSEYAKDASRRDEQVTILQHRLGELEASGAADANSLSQYQLSIVKKFYWMAAKAGRAAGWLSLAILIGVSLVTFLSAPQMAWGGKYLLSGISMAAMLWDFCGKLFGLSATTVSSFVERQVRRVAMLLLVRFLLPAEASNYDSTNVPAEIPNNAAKTAA